MLYEDEGRRRELLRFPMLRQQGPQPEGKPNLCLADLVAPVGSGVADSIGAFAVTSEADDLAEFMPSKPLALWASFARAGGLQGEPNGR